MLVRVSSRQSRQSPVSARILCFPSNKAARTTRTCIFNSTAAAAPVAGIEERWLDWHTDCRCCACGIIGLFRMVGSRCMNDALFSFFSDATESNLYSMKLVTLDRSELVTLAVPNTSWVRLFTRYGVCPALPLRCLCVLLLLLLLLSSP